MTGRTEPTSRSDHGRDMSPRGRLDDETIESIVAGDAIDGFGVPDARLELIVAFVRRVRTVVDGPSPPPSRALRRVLAGAAACRARPASRRQRRTCGSTLSRARGRRRR